MSILPDSFDMSGVYVDRIDVFVTCVDFRAIGRQWSVIGDIVTVAGDTYKLWVAIDERRLAWANELAFLGSALFC